MNAETPVAAPAVHPRPVRPISRMSPLTRRRWANFKANKRGYWSLWIFLALYAVTLCAELIANDKPILLSYRGEIYAPVLRAYPETTFGGVFETEANYQDPAVRAMIAEGDGWAIWPIIPYSYRTIDYDIPVTAPSPPSARHWLGTDDQARDVLARIIYGFRLSVTFGLLLTFFSSIIGITAGAIQGYFGGWTDLIFQRCIEIVQSLPMLYLLIIMASFLTPSFFTLLGALLLVSWMTLVHVVRAEFLRARNLDYVRAARALGLGNRTIMFRHILPNAMVATITFLPFIVSSSITILTALDFLGFGMPRGSPSIGELLNQAKNNLYAPWLGIAGFAVMATMLSLLIFIGEAARDAFDPRKST
ncbi:microcin C transport system permease protein [Sphingobium sp. B2D3A]|nr:MULTISPECIES: ABC transporter permease [unclassified Sphingobium]MCW2337038.1 microcin C transport system permease protein [Sphingobium sp. B2D3A]MCW2386791.1 microcin C transport system permease protein [Sphingobium sp. B2D3D]